MIQELLGGGGLVEERKISIPGALLLDHGHSPSSTPSMTPSSSATSSPSSSAENQNLRCPRCDSSNTKFCYYNNYNLTQPRHFCKTCRRYWTKGGALRNVPIGGGCRKSKSPGSSNIGGSSCKSGGNKARNCPSDMAGIGIKPSFVGCGGDGFSTHELPTGPVLWASSHNSNLLSLLKDTNPNPNSNPVTMKEDLSQLVSDATLVANALSARTLGFDHMGHVPSTGFCTPLIWKSNQYQCQPQHQMLQPQQQQQNNSTLFGTEVQSSSIQELYQRLRSSTTNNNYADHCQVLMANMGCSPLLPPPTTAAITTATTITTTTAAATTTASVMEAIPVAAGGEFGFWNLPMSWSDMPTTNGAFP